VSAPATAPGPAGLAPLGRSRPLAWWGTLLALGAATSMLTTMAFAHVYLGALGDVRPGLGSPLVALVLLLASSATMAFARLRARTRVDAAGALPALVVTAALGLAFVLLQVQHYAGLGLDVQREVADASFLVNVVMHHVLAATGLVALVVAAARLARLPDSLRSRDAVFVTGLVWQTTVLAWVPLFALLYLAPGLT
jgi:cytochrome c oxidase subunit 3